VRKEVKAMGVVKQDDVIAWRDGNTICAGCGDPGEAKPMTQADFEETDVVTCDDCGENPVTSNQAGGRWPTPPGL
jgi:hypothetical protein